MKTTTPLLPAALFAAMLSCTAPAEAVAPADSGQGETAPPTEAQEPAPAGGVADGDPVRIGTWRVVESAVLGETRRLMVSLPDDHRADCRYPVVYLLDGDGHFTHTVGLLRFLEDNGEAPPCIVVGVPNTDRTRDLTPPTGHRADEFPTAGGVDDFLRFLRDEVFPLMETEYGASHHRTLVGHSFGGLTVMHSLVHHPQDYAGYLAISPSLWWDKQRLVAEAAEAFADASMPGTRLYLTLGSEGDTMLSGYRRMEAVLSESSPAGLRWDSLRMPDENHQSVPYRSSLLGLGFLFEDWALPDLPEVFLAGGWEAVQRAFAEGAERYGTPRALDDMALPILIDGLLGAGHTEAALDALDHAPAPLEPPAAAYEWIGGHARAAGETASARRAFESAVRLDPGTESLREQLAELGGDPDAVPRPAALTAEEAAAYVGVYAGEVEDGDLGQVTVVATADGLRAEIAEGPKAPLQRIQGDRFQMFQGFVTVEFRRDAAGAVSAMVVKAPGEDPAELLRTDE